MFKWFVKKRRLAAAVLAAGVIGALTATAVAQSQRFPDVAPDHYAYEAVGWAAEVGVTTGYTDGTFKPQRPLSKRHAVVFMERYYDEIPRSRRVSRLHPRRHDGAAQSHQRRHPARRRAGAQ